MSQTQPSAVRLKNNNFSKHI